MVTNGSASTVTDEFFTIDIMTIDIMIDEIITFDILTDELPQDDIYIVPKLMSAYPEF